MPEIIRLLCVDDEINILNVIRRQLLDENIEIHCALTVSKGLQFLQEHRPMQVIVSDYRMPGMNGMEFLKQAELICPEAVFIILSGFADIPIVKQSLENKHLFRILRKPWRAEELRKVIGDAVRSSRQTSSTSHGAIL
ncbi:MAG: response regulator [Desulfuromonadales bacterium]|nr:response regulator [Desulfuromonadales bacterium]